MNLEPGRELDALVAEEVIGWKFVGGFDLEMNFDKWAHDENGHEKFYSDVPHYSTDISDAWGVVEKFKEIYCIDIEWDRSDFYCCFAGADLKQNAVCKKGVSAPHAICLASLKAVGAIE